MTVGRNVEFVPCPAGNCRHKSLAEKKKCQQFDQDRATGPKPIHGDLRKSFLHPATRERETGIPPKDLRR